MLDTSNYTVGWICALSTEFTAAIALLDDPHEGPRCVATRDTNSYALGRIGSHNVVITVLPVSEYGKAAAANVAANMLSSFPNVRIGLMVGIGGGAPSSRHDIRLGDIVVSVPRDKTGAVFHYDFGKTIQGQEFQTTGFLDQPPKIVRTAVQHLKSHYEIHGHHIEETIDQVLQRFPRLRRIYSKPDQHKDRLYLSGVLHPQGGDGGCEVICGAGTSQEPKLVVRSERTADEDNPAIHYGTIASADQMMKDAHIRDKLAAKEDVLCFEMEAAGLNQFPCLVIRGICDYSDTHKNKEWQGYAAMVAAAYAKDLLSRIHPNQVETEKKITLILSNG